MEFKNYFKEKPLFIVALVFILISIFHIIYASLCLRGIAFDGSIWFLTILDNLSTNKEFDINVFYHTYPTRPRAFSLILDQTPMVLGYELFGIKSKYWLGFLFTLPLFLYPFLIVIHHYLLAKFKTQRYDIFLLGLILYCVFIIPTSMYSIIEIPLGASLFFLLYHYLAANIKYNVWDVLIILFLVVVSYCSTEAIFPCGIVMFLTSFYFAKQAQNKKDKIIKLFIGFNSLIISAFYTYFSIELINEIGKKNFLTQDRIFTELEGILGNITSYQNYTILFVFILSLLLIWQVKTKLNKLSVGILSSICILTLVYILNTKQYLSAYFFSLRFYLYLVLPILILVGIAIEALKKKFEEKEFYKEKISIILSNITIVILLCGIFNTSLEINNSFHFNNKVEDIQEIQEESRLSLISPNGNKDLKKLYHTGFGSMCFDCDTYTYDSIAFDENYKIDNLISYDNRNKGCQKKLYFKKGRLILPFNDLSIKNQFWDLTYVYKKTAKKTN